VTLSTCETNYIVACLTICQVLWLCSLFNELKMYHYKKFAYYLRQFFVGNVLFS